MHENVHTINGNAVHDHEKLFNMKIYLTKYTFQQLYSVSISQILNGSYLKEVIQPLPFVPDRESRAETALWPLKSILEKVMDSVTRGQL